MIDKLIELISQFADNLKFWEIINYYERGVRLRYGDPHGGELESGFHWKLPFADSIICIMVKTTTMRLPEQTVTTKDNKSVVVKAVIKYEIKDAVKVLLEVNDPIDAVADLTQGIIRDHIINRRYEDCNNIEFNREITVKARSEGNQWGIKIREVTLTDFGEMLSVRLLNTPVAIENHI